MDRKAAIGAGIPKEGSIGVEIGPFHNPIAPKRDGWNTLIVDFADTAMLRESAARHPSEAIRSMAGNIEPVDLVWRDGSLHDLVRGATDRELDFVLASHSIEHMPDLLGFLESSERLLKVGGTLGLAVPDLRYTFDFFLSPSTLGQVIAAGRERPRRHSSERLLDALSRNAHCGGEGCWIPGTGREIDIRRTLVHAWNVYRQDLGTSEYRDCHAWHFTPSSFELLLVELRHLGLVGLAVRRLISARERCFGSEFIVQLEKVPRTSDSQRLAECNQVDERRLRLLSAMVMELAERVHSLPSRFRSASS
jgi:hypothetical protein